MKLPGIVAAGIAGFVLSAAPGWAQVAVVSKVEVVKAVKEDAKKADKQAEDKPQKAEVEVEAVPAEQAVVVQQIVAGGPDDQNQWAAMEKQFSQQFRGLLNGQLHSVRVVCKPSDEQFKQIKSDGEKVLQEITKKCVDCQKKMQQGGFQFGRDPYPNPSKDIADGVSLIVKKRLSADQATRFQNQIDKRTAHRKQVAIMNIIAKMDKDLILAKQQRERLAEVLTTQWKDNWGGNLQIYMQDDFQQYPALPDAQITPLLSDQQAKVWKAVPKQDVQYWGWGGFMGAIGVIDMDGDVQGAVEAVELAIPLAVEAVPLEAVEVEEPVKKLENKPDAKKEPDPPRKEKADAKQRPVDQPKDARAKP